jgi:hypothetical protein
MSLTIPPLQKRVWWVDVVMVFKLSDDFCPDDDLLHRITKKISYQAYVPCAGQFDQNGNVGNVLLQRRV